MFTRASTLLLLSLLLGACSTSNKFTINDVHVEFTDNGHEVRLGRDGSLLFIDEVYIMPHQQSVLFGTEVCRIDREFVQYPRSVLSRRSVRDGVPELCNLAYDDSVYYLSCILPGGKKLTTKHVYRHFTKFKSTAHTLDDVIMRAIMECDAEKCPKRR